MQVFKRRRHRNQIGVSFYWRGGGAQIALLDRRFNDARQIRLHDMNFTTVNGLHGVLIDINADHPLLPGGERGSGWQANISKANH